MTTEEVKKIRDEVEHRYCDEQHEQDINAMCELYKKIKECLPVSDKMVSRNILDYGSLSKINVILWIIDSRPDWKEVFHDEIERLERNREYFKKREQELVIEELEYKRKLSWWKRLWWKPLFGKSTKV